MDDLFRVPGQGGPYDIDRIPNSPLVSASIHPMISLEVADDRFDLDPLLAAGKREPEMALLDLLPLEAGIFS